MKTKAQQTIEQRSLLQTMFYFLLRELGIVYTLNTIHNDADKAEILSAFEKRFSPDLQRLAQKPPTKKAGIR